MNSYDNNHNYQPIENYAIIGNLRTIALVGMNGSIDFMCFPHFDSPSIFAGILDNKKGGYFKICPIKNHARIKQSYLPDTNVLLTRFLFKGGVCEISDFMPISKTQHHDSLVRRVKVIKGSIDFRMECSPSFDYGRASHVAQRRKEEVVFISQGEDKQAFRLRCSVPYQIKNGAAVANFTLKEGQSTTFIWEEAYEGHFSTSFASGYNSKVFVDTVNYWRQWLKQSKYKGRWRDMVHRSALTLKMLTSSTYGAIVAAPTFGLPENIGGNRNWDYRYTWIRDASFSLNALIQLGFTEEAKAFMHWIKARASECGQDGTLQIMYAIDGHHKLKEIELNHLSGYKNSQPVRIGNGAANQLQLDIYGELMDAIHLYDIHGEHISYELWQNLSKMVDWVCANWQKADEGIWEVRGGKRNFLYSKLMCWVAIDRAMKIASSRSFPCTLVRWRRTRDEIYNTIFTNFWSNKQKSFIQYQGSQTLDASSLLMPLVGFIGPHDPRWLSTLSAIEQNLASDSLVYRYKSSSSSNLDGLNSKEGTFCMCSFWFIECLARSGNTDKARFLFEKMLGYANHVGLFSEELGPQGEHLGNFPQAFTHLSLISAAIYLDKVIG